MTHPIGKRRWAIAEGYIPPDSAAKSRELASHEAPAANTPALRVVDPGTSVHASVTLKGLALLATVPVITRCWPVAVKRSAFV